MTKADLYVERGANFLEELSRKVAAEGGFAAKLSEPLAEDAVFLRKLKPTLVLARIKGEPPSDGQAESVRVAPAPAPAPEPKPKKKQKKMKSNGGGPSPIVVIGAALIAGILIAKFVDWRGHAHPRL